MSLLWKRFWFSVLCLWSALHFLYAYQSEPKPVSAKEYDDLYEMGKAYSVAFSFVGNYQINSEINRSESGKTYSLSPAEILNDLNQNLVSERIDTQIEENSTLFISYGKKIEKVLIFPKTQGNLNYYVPNNDLKNKIIISECILSDKEQNAVSLPRCHKQSDNRGGCWIFVVLEENNESSRGCSPKEAERRRIG